MTCRTPWATDGVNTRDRGAGFQPTNLLVRARGRLEICPTPNTQDRDAPRAEVSRPWLIEKYRFVREVGCCQNRRIR